MQAGGQRFDPAQLHQSLTRLSGSVLAAEGLRTARAMRRDDLTVCMGRLIDGIEYPSGEIKVCTFIECDEGACFGYIVKRRYVWKLPGVLNPLGLRRPSPVSEKPCDGLVGRNWWRDWR